MLQSRSWRWFVVRLFGLTTDSRTWTALKAHLAEHEDDDTDLLDRNLGIQRPSDTRP